MIIASSLVPDYPPNPGTPQHLPQALATQADAPQASQAMGLGLKLTVKGPGFRVKGSGFRVQGLPKSQKYVNNGPKPIITAIRAIISHTFGVQV